MALKSWVDSANNNSDFPLENLPFGVFRAGRRAHIGVAIGDRILDLAGCFEDGLLAEEATAAETLNPLMAKGREAARALRTRLQELLANGAEGEPSDRSTLRNVACLPLIRRNAIGLVGPMRPGRPQVPPRRPGSRRG